MSKDYTGSSAEPFNHRDTPEAPKWSWVVWLVLFGVCLYVIPAVFW